MLSLVVLIFFFVVCSGVMAMVDAALLSVTYAEAEEMVIQGLWGARALRTLVRRLTRPVIVIVIATSFVNILGPILIGQEAVALFGSTVIGIITAVLAVLTILFSEIIPKAIGTHYAPTVARWVAPLVLSIIIALYPLILALEALVSLFKVGKRPIGTEEQIRALARIGGGAGHIAAAEREMIARVFILNDRRARDLMTPRRMVVALRSTLTIRAALRVVEQHPHSRYPVYEPTIDHIVGLVTNRDLHEAKEKNWGDATVGSIMREILTVPADMRSDALLAYFRREKTHLAVVRDQSKTAGVVSLEDVLEELVGEIEDEREAGKMLT